MGKSNSVSWWDERYGHFREGKSYRKNTAHQKMPQDRRDKISKQKLWKRKKEKKNYRGGRWYYGGKARGFCLLMAQRKLRRWTKQKLHWEQYDDIPTEYPKTMFYDPWDWN